MSDEPLYRVAEDSKFHVNNIEYQICKGFFFHHTENEDTITFGDTEYIGDNFWFVIHNVNAIEYEMFLKSFTPKPPIQVK